MKKVKIVAKIILVILVVALFSHCAYEIYTQRIYPEGGMWYCEELQIYINFDGDGMSKAIVDGEEIDCRALYEDSSSLIRVNRVYDDVVYIGQCEFAGYFVSLKDNELVLRGRDTNAEYTFVKIEVGGTRGRFV